MTYIYWQSTHIHTLLFIFLILFKCCWQWSMGNIW